jgi:hypothetical protein
MYRQRDLIDCSAIFYVKVFRDLNGEYDLLRAQRNIEGGRELLSKDSDGESTKDRLILFKINWGLRAVVASVLVDP